MKTPKSFGGNLGVLNRSMIVIIFLYVGMGFFGYLKYGSDIKGSITLNLPQNELYVINDDCVTINLHIYINIKMKLFYQINNDNHENCRPAQLAKGMLAFGIYITHALACYVAIDITWNDYVLKRVENSPRKLLWEYVVRTLLVLVTCRSSSSLLIHSRNSLKRLLSFI